MYTIKFKARENGDSGWTYHSMPHIENVTNIVTGILTSLNYEEDFIYKAKIACLLRDTGATIGKRDHAIRGYYFAKELFEKLNIHFEDDDLVLEAIKIHSDDFDTDNIIALALILADKLDVKKNKDYRNRKTN